MDYLALFTHPIVYAPQPPAFFSPNLFSPHDCLDSALSPTLAHLVTCFEKYTVPSDFYNATTYASAQPTPSQRAAWSNITHSLLDLSTTPNPPSTCTSISLPSPLQDIYSLSSFTDTNTSSSYCVLSETHSTDGVYTKGWGLVIVPATSSALQRHLHISAPHPLFDTGTPVQAAALFAAVGSKSLVIHGRHRKAFLSPAGCVEGKDYPKTDPAHDKVNIPYPRTKALCADCVRDPGRAFLRH